MFNGYDGRYLKFEKNGILQGVSLVNFDHTWTNEHRAYLRHISATTRENFNIILFLTIDYIWHKMLADLVRIDLYHVKEEEKKDPEGEDDV